MLIGTWDHKSTVRPPDEKENDIHDTWLLMNSVQLDSLRARVRRLPENRPVKPLYVQPSKRVIDTRSQ